MSKRSEKIKRRRRRAEKKLARRSADTIHPAARLIEAGGLPSDFTILEASEETLVVIEAADGDDAAKLKTFRMTGYTGGRLHLGNFPHPVIVDLSGMRIPKKAIPILRNHSQDRIVGHGKAAIESSSIRVAGTVSGASDDSRQVIESSANEFPWQSSIGAKAEKMVYVDAGEKVQVNGRAFTGPLYVARQSTLREVSFVALGADEGGATATVAAASAHPPTLEAITMNFEKWLEAKGHKLTDLDESQVTLLKGIWEKDQAVQTDTDVNASDDDDETEIEADDENLDIEAQIKADRAKLVAERKRIAKIGSICASYNSPKFKVQGEDIDLEAHAIAEGWDVTRTELEAMRESRPAASFGQAHSHESRATVEALGAAMILRADGTLDSPHYTNGIQAVAVGVPQFLRRGINDDQRQQIMEAAHRFSDLSPVDLCAEAVRLDGGTPSTNRTETIRAAFSGGTLTNIFTTSINARLLVGYMESGDSTVGWTQQRDVPDFKQYENIGLTPGAGLAPHPRGGKADHWSRSDRQETGRIARFSRQFFADDQDFIDGNLGALERTPADMGAASRRLVPDLVYALLLSNPTINETSRALFNATDANLDTGSALAAGTLRTGVSEMMIVQDNGVNLNLSPTHILVPPSLKHLAYELTHSSQIFLAGSTDTERGNQNALRVDNITPVPEARLENGVTHPTTGTTYAGANNDWILVDGRVPTIEVGFLRGTGRAPQTSTWRRSGEGGEWGIGWSTNMDVGAMAEGWRGMRKHEG